MLRNRARNDQKHMVRRLAATTGMRLTFARTNIAEFLIAAFQVPFARRHRFATMIEHVSQLRETLQLNLQFLIADSAAELCLYLRNIAAMFGGADKKFISKEQAFQRAVLS